MQSITLNGLQIHSNTAELGFVVNNNIQGLAHPDKRLNSYNKPGQHGSIVASHFYDSRTLIMTGRVSGVNVNTYEANRKLLVQATKIVLDSNNNPTPVLLQMTTMDNLLVQAYVYLPKPLTIDQLSVTLGSFYLELYSPDPLFYDQAVQVATVFPISGGGVTYPVIYPVTYAAATGGSLILTNNGDANTHPVITFNGPLTSPLVENITTGETFQINGNLTSSDQLVVDMQAKTMLKNNSTNALSMFVSTNTWMEIIPGMNTLKLLTGLSSDTGNVFFSFRNARTGL